MSDDIVIRNDGSAYVSDITGDFRKASAAQVVEQKLYASFMEMDPKIITSKKFTTYEDVKNAMMQYMYSYFSNDRDVNPSYLTIDISETPGNDGVKLVISYEGTTEEGEAVSVSSGMGYSLSAGALSSVDYLPDWLATPKGSSTIDIEYIVNVTSPVSEFEIPMQPYYSEDDPLGSLIRVLLSNQTDTGSEEMAFSVNVYPERSKYPISSFLSENIRRSKVIYTVSASTGTVDYNIIREYGEYVIVVPYGTESGTISGTVKVISAVTSTTTSAIRCSDVNNSIFELRRNKGKYYVTFPKTLQVGSYRIKYKALTGE